MSKTDHRPVTRERRVRRERAIVALRMIAAVIVGLVFIAPIYWMCMTAMKTGNEAFLSTPKFIVWPNLHSFVEVFQQGTFGLALGTSLYVSLTSTIACLLLAAGISYPLARLDFKGQKQIATWILSLKILPPIVVIIPLFLLLRAIGLTGKPEAIVVMYTYMNLPLAVWLMRGFFADLPKEIEEASFVDGARRIRTFFEITLPLAVPGLVATALLCFIFSWNEFLFANVLTGADTRTAPVSLTEYVTPVSIEWNKIMAAGTMVVLPVWFAALSVQRYLVRGLTLGAVK
jgi:ABC-type glycerol-3-phosphate transport system permease component